MILCMINDSIVNTARHASRMMAAPGYGIPTATGTPGPTAATPLSARHSTVRVVFCLRGPARARGTDDEHEAQRLRRMSIADSNGTVARAGFEQSEDHYNYRPHATRVWLNLTYS